MVEKWISINSPASKVIKAMMSFLDMVRAGDGEIPTKAVSGFGATLSSVISDNGVKNLCPVVT